MKLQHKPNTLWLEVVENIIINKKLILNNSENINTTNMASSKEVKSKKQQNNEARDTLMLEVKKQSLEDFKTDNIILLHGDCLERMKEIPDDSVNLILCDLPYGTTKCKWDTIIDINKLWIEYQRIIKKPSGVILLFGQQPFTSMLVSSNYKWFKYNIIWKKNKTTQFLLANYRPMKCTEDICVFSQGGAAAASKKKGNMTYNPQNLIPVDIKKKIAKKE